jgi:hypothetical protein
MPAAAQGGFGTWCMFAAVVALFIVLSTHGMQDLKEVEQASFFFS